MRCCCIFEHTCFVEDGSNQLIAIVWSVIIFIVQVVDWKVDILANRFALSEIIETDKIINFSSGCCSCHTQSGNKTTLLQSIGNIDVKVERHDGWGRRYGLETNALLRASLDNGGGNLVVVMCVIVHSR